MNFLSQLEKSVKSLKKPVQGSVTKVIHEIRENDQVIW